MKRIAAATRFLQRGAMKTARVFGLLIGGLWCAAPIAGHASPDEEAMGKTQGYPVAPKGNLVSKAPYMVGSYSAMDRLFPHCVVKAGSNPLVLKPADGTPAPRYRLNNLSFPLDDYMEHQRATALLVLKDDQIVFERYGYDRKPSQRMLSNSMAKTIAALAIGKALEKGAIRSLDDTAARYEPRLAHSLLGETSIRNLLRMASGIRFDEEHDRLPSDSSRFFQSRAKMGLTRALAELNEREYPAGERFNYVSPTTMALGLVLRGATGQSVCDFVGQHLWQPMGAESDATWLIDPRDKVELTGGNFNATVRDYARLGWLLAHDGVRDGKSVIDREFLLDMTDAARQPPAFRPGAASHHGSTYFGYGYQVWLFPGGKRRFALQGIHGQNIFVDPELRLVLVHTAVAERAGGNKAMAQELNAVWRGLVNHYGRW